MTLEELKASGAIIFECIAGSKAYGLDTSTSDTDIRGVFIAPKSSYYSFEYVDQVSDETNDVVYYELNKFMELCYKNNPNILELLNIPEACILHKHPIYDSIKAESFLSKQCEKTFANYAYAQIKKARGLNKKIVNPMEKERKSVLHFCYVHSDSKSVPFVDFLEERGWNSSHCGLTKVNHMKDCYHLFYDSDGSFNGVISSVNSNEISLSSIEKGKLPVALLYFNKDGYSSYCKEYKEYWSWVEKRNEARFQTTVLHQKNYDSKNMMHTFRLLAMAKEIATQGSVLVKRPDRSFLLDVKRGVFEYDELLLWADQKKEELNDLFNKSDLMERPDLDKVNDLMVRLRDEFYKMNEGNYSRNL